ncbi:hypothetical protein HMPREF2883_01200 [Actinomyces sp. HMSC075C01]|uniref:Uncharacterized protein n=1 Tax=Actinomyces oris TaxID=544580 RepID=A0A1Q8VVP7_9ACTO|nr:MULTISPECIES: hypothetical protein [Actinomyces]OFR57838.1 hypothetical protein HMPREF2883_01200 [Actinomyces sp. HMSC075C01]OLO52249.1 hypothetical protein BKH27_09690 [Actinomyces oris]
MSYDLLIFEPDCATDEDFPRWWKQMVAQWDGPRDFSTIDGSTPAIRSIYRDLIRAFPPYNGPDALSEAEREEREVEGLPVADYTIGTDYIYISVGWSDANALVKIVGQMAWTQRLAVAYVSEDSSIVRP